MLLLYSNFNRNTSYIHTAEPEFEFFINILNLNFINLNFHILELISYMQYYFSIKKITSIHTFINVQKPQVILVKSNFKGIINENWDCSLKYFYSELERTYGF